MTKKKQTDTPQTNENSKYLEKAAELFKLHPGVPEAFFTADGLSFFTTVEAEMHAGGLADKTIITIKNE